MAWWQIAGLALSILIAYGGLVAFGVRLHSRQDEQWRVLEALRNDMDRRVSDVVGLMEKRDEQAARERLEILTSIKDMGERLEGQIKDLFQRVYERN